MKEENTFMLFLQIFSKKKKNDTFLELLIYVNKIYK